MAKTNVPVKLEKIYTHEGAPAFRINAELELRRSLMSCMLWENTFYESGVEIAERIKNLIPEVEPNKVALMAIEAREKFKLRHVPLLVVREMARSPKHKYLVADTLERVIQRADELAEFLAIYWKEGRQPLSAQVKKGLQKAFNKFSEYNLAKYNRDNAVKLRDVLFLSHAKPKDQEQADVWKKLVEGTLATPDTWEVALSTGKDKKETWERLMKEKALGGLAFIRNLRNMHDVKVDEAIIRWYAQEVDISRILPFRFISAAKAAPQYEEEMDSLLLKCCSQVEKLKGRTVIVIDVSGSMYHTGVSEKSDMNRALAACALGAIGRELCEDAGIYATAGNDGTQKHQTQLVPSRHGMALVDAIYDMCAPLGGGGIFLTPVCRWLAERESNVERMIVITDEQDCARDNSDDAPGKAQPLGKYNYLINVNSYKNGIGYGKSWIHIDGFSESIFDYIREADNGLQNDIQQ